MHSNNWAMLYLTMVPAGLFLIIAAILALTRKRYAKLFLLAAICLLLIPGNFIISHFKSQKKEMKLRAGIYIATKKEEITSLCGDTPIDTLKLTLKENGNFSFNHKPCFSNKTNGKWKWINDMVSTYTIFEKMNDSLYLHYPSDEIIDTLCLMNDERRYITFTRGIAME